MLRWLLFISMSKSLTTLRMAKSLTSWWKSFDYLSNKHFKIVEYLKMAKVLTTWVCPNHLKWKSKKNKVHYSYSWAGFSSWVCPCCVCQWRLHPAPAVHGPARGGTRTRTASASGSCPRSCHTLQQQLCRHELSHWQQVNNKDLFIVLLKLWFLSPVWAYM